ncbi:MAG TPA: S41 family peptidase [Egibacteraceae bacterium]|nr:S41 family peptidase [Actinomycetota bacterium]HWB72472.1 S41 family peptidase [Egibacteraceae bacterium]
MTSPASPLDWRARATAVACLLVFVAGLVVASHRLGTLGAAPGAAGLPSELVPIREAYQRLQREAVDVPGDAELVRGAIEGMLGTLDDPYAVYYDPAALAAFHDQLDGRFSGVGLVLQEAPEGPTVANVLEGSPAAAAGVQVGERIVGVDGRDVHRLPIEAVVPLVKGPDGTPVTLSLEGGTAGPRQVTMRRATIEVPNLETRRLDDGAGYVRLVLFDEEAGADVRSAVERLIADGAQGIVLDLRGNPGGLLIEAVRVASVFVEDGPIVSVEERAGQRETFSAAGEALENLPLVVLVDQGSASASEIVAGAIQDLGRGVVVGTATFGKGTVQTVRVLVDGSGVKFTTAEYFTPSGDSIEEAGVVPDETVAPSAAGGTDAQLLAAQRALRSMLAGVPG